MRILRNCIIVLILFSGCENNQINKSIDANYFENGDLRSYTKVNDKEGKPGIDILFNDKHELERVGHFAYDRPLGYLSYYYKNQQIGLKQSIVVENEPYVNQYWGFDESGNVDRNMSNFFSVKSSLDTISVNTEWEIEVKLDCPYFDDGMNVVFGEFDRDYNLIDSSSLKIIKGDNFEVKHKFVFSTKGVKIVRGYIDNYEYLSDKKGENFGRSRMNYFKKKVVVVE